MSLFLIKRSFADRLELDEAAMRAIEKANAEAGVEWLFSFLSVDRQKTYCLYRAPSADAVRVAAERLDIPADVIVEVTEIGPRAMDAPA